MALFHTWKSCGAHGRRWAAAGFCVAGAVHRASWRSYGARGCRWAAAGFAWKAQYRELPDCLSRGRRSTQSLLEELRRAWAPLGRGWLLCGRRSTQSLLKELRRGWLRVAGAVQRASWLPFAWQAQYTEPPEGAGARVGAAGPRLASRDSTGSYSLGKTTQVWTKEHRTRCWQCPKIYCIFWLRLNWYETKLHIYTYIVYIIRNLEHAPIWNAV